MTGTYLERGQPIVIVHGWRGTTRDLPDLSGVFAAGTGLGRTAPRNVLIRRADGTTAVRPFRGLRRPLDPSIAAPAA
jgi:hypothetical protein